MKKVISSILICVLFVSIFASDRPKKVPLQQEKTIVLKLTLTEVNAVLTALSKLPYEQSAPVIANITNQGNAQMQPLSPKDTSKAKH